MEFSRSCNSRFYEKKSPFSEIYYSQGSWRQHAAPRGVLEARYGLRQVLYMANPYRGYPAIVRHGLLQALPVSPGADDEKTAS